MIPNALTPQTLAYFIARLARDVVLLRRCPQSSRVVVNLLADTEHALEELCRIREERLRAGDTR